MFDIREHGGNFGSGRSKLNIYTQLTEPVKKEGIWLQTDQSYSNVLSESDIIQGGTFINQSLLADLPMGIGFFGSVYLNGFIYTFGGMNTNTGTSSTANCYKYDVANNIWTQIASLPFTATATNGYYARATQFNGRIFVGLNGGTSDAIYNKIYEYNVSSNSFTLLGTVPYTYDSSKPIMVAADDGIHVMGGYNSNASSNKNLFYHYVLKYDNTWTQLANMPLGGYVSFGFIYGGDIYVYSINGNNTFYKYNIATNTYTQMGSLSISVDSMTILNNKVYYMESDASYTKKNLYSYDIVDNTSTLIGAVNYYAYGAGLVASTSSVFIIGGRQQAVGYTYSTKLQGYAVTSKVYQDKTIVILRSNENIGAYLTELVSAFNRALGDKYTRFTSGFDNVWLYTNNNLQEYPAYYGTGTAWVKFKN